MPEPTRDTVMNTLAKVMDDQSGRDVVSLGYVTGLVVKGGNVGFALDVGSADGARMEPLRSSCERALKAMPGVLSATVVLTAESGGAPAEPSPATVPRDEVPPPEPKRPSDMSESGIRDVKAIIAVASGKGGVGKSTTAVNLALSLKNLGLSVGILDADIYGPSMPIMLGLKGKPESDGKKLIPMEGLGLKTMSIGVLVDPDKAMIWRGPMVMGALGQLINDVEWGDLDILIADMPPGTGDAQLTMAQRVPLAGAVIVTTPQDIALVDARKGIDMFNRVDVPILGLIENMSQFTCPNCGEVSHIFGQGGAEKAAKDFNVDVLGSIPLLLEIRETSDNGKSVVLDDPDGAPARAYAAIAETLKSKLGL